MLPEYGRVLGLWPYWRGENALWVNPEFFRSLQSGSKQEEWLNPGGDRMWLCPEGEFFVEDPERREDSFHVPHALDPGAYSRVPDKSQYCMASRGDLWACRAQQRITFRLQRRFRVYAEKELAALWGTTYLRQAGYDEEAVLELPDCPIAVGLWNIIPVPAGGAARVPLDRGWADGPAAAFPPGAADPVDGCVLMSCRGERAVRAWLGADDVRTRAAYIVDQAETGRSLMVLREFSRAPAERYAREPGEEGAPVVGLSCPGPRGRYVEIGVRSPAAGRPAAGRKLTWKISLWAFSGRTEEILGLARRLTS